MQSKVTLFGSGPIEILLRGQLKGATLAYRYDRISLFGARKCEIGHYEFCFQPGGGPTTSKMMNRGQLRLLRIAVLTFC